MGLDDQSIRSKRGCNHYRIVCGKTDEDKIKQTKFIFILVGYAYYPP